ncbi:MAG: hypothetical protein WKF37_05815 [Bryobacteraceae bacterium]
MRAHSFPFAISLSALLMAGIVVGAEEKLQPAAARDTVAKPMTDKERKRDAKLPERVGRPLSQVA